MIESVFSYIAMIIGILLVLLGVIGWKMQKIFLLGDKKKINIKEKNIKGLIESVGKTYIILGIARVGIGLIN